MNVPNTKLIQVKPVWVKEQWTLQIALMVLRDIPLTH
jgi:hypothetical protein